MAESDQSSGGKPQHPENYPSQSASAIPPPNSRRVEYPHPFLDGRRVLEPLRDGETLIVPNGTVLPASCLRCGQPSVGKRITDFAVWYPKWFWITVPILGPFATVVFQWLTRRVIIHYWLCQTHQRERSRCRAIAWLGVAVTVAAGLLFVKSLGWDDQRFARSVQPWVLAAIALGFLTASAAALFGRVVRVVWVADGSAALRGVCRQVLDSYPTAIKR